MVKLLVSGKEYFGAKEIAERLVKDIEEEQVGIVYRFLGLDDADEEEIEKLNHIYGSILAGCDYYIYYSYNHFDFFNYEDNEKYTIYNEQFLPISEAIEKIEEDIDWLSDLKGILYQKK